MARAWKVVGFKRVSYMSKRTNKQVNGNTIYVASPGVTPDVTGLEVKEVWLSDSTAVYKPQEGDMVNIYYNERGYVDDIVPARDEK